MNAQLLLYVIAFVLFIAALLDHPRVSAVRCIAALDDARKDRDHERQMRAKEVEKFLESLKYRDQEFKSVAEAINSVKRQQ